jgi:hypothetical protein
MADPLQRAVPLAPFRPSASAWNRMLDAARALDSGAGNPAFGDVPHLLVRVRNDTGADLPALSVVKLGASIFTEFTAARLLANLPTPMFAGETPTGSTDAFAVLVEPAREDKFALAAVAGVVPCEVSVSDAGHAFAAPGATTARLTSATSGPAKIIDRESGTGDKKAWVLLGSAGGGGSVTPAATNYPFTSNGTLVTLPAGKYYCAVHLRWGPTTVVGYADGDYAAAQFAVNGFFTMVDRRWLQVHGVVPALGNFQAEHSVAGSMVKTLASSTAVSVAMTVLTNTAKTFTYGGDLVVMPVS